MPGSWVGNETVYTAMPIRSRQVFQARMLNRGDVLIEFCFSSKEITRKTLLDVANTCIGEATQETTMTIKVGIR